MNCSKGYFLKAVGFGAGDYVMGKDFSSFSED